MVKLWSAVEEMYFSKNRAKAVNTRLTLAIAQKGSQSVAEYVSKKRTLGDEMAAADRKLVEYILTVLSFDFNPIISSLLARKETVTVSEVYTQLLAFETPMELWGSGNFNSSANAANRGSCGGGSNRGRGPNHGHTGGQGRDNNNTFPSNQRQGNNGGGGGRGGRGRNNHDTGHS